MLEMLDKILLWIHIPFGMLSLILFWIPIGFRKGSPMHKKVGRQYYITMWIVVISAFLLSIINLITGRMMSAVFLGFLSIITAYPLWYSYEILKQGRQWTDRYFMFRKAFVSTLFLSGVAIFLLGAIRYQFQGMGTMMGFFGILAFPAGREFLMTKEKAMDKETKLKMHIRGTIISGIAAHTAFFAFGGRRILVDILHMDTSLMFIPWIAPTLLGFTYSRYMRRKFKTG
ncbi:MAG: hypothetical protein AAF705_13350 [Bacteroidota bacterium]